MATQPPRRLSAPLACLLCLLGCAGVRCGPTAGAGGGGSSQDGGRVDAAASRAAGRAAATASRAAAVAADTAAPRLDGEARDGASDAVVVSDALLPPGDLAGQEDAGPDAFDGAVADLAGSPDAGPAAPERYVVHAHLPPWQQAFLHYSVGGGPWTQPPGEPMQPRQPPHYHRGEAPGGVDLQFVFSDGADGWYPGGQGNDFRVSWPEVWVHGGLLHTSDPGGPRPADELVVLTLNLHTYQEVDAAEKLARVAEVIARLRPDFVCLQECAQHSRSPRVEDPRAVPGEPVDAIREDNMARIIAADLAERFGFEVRYTFSWAHHGWDVWEEGLAVLTPHPVLETGQRYVSRITTRDNINSRKAVLLAAQVPGHGRVHAFSVHTSWGPTQAGQIRALAEWVAEHEAAHPLATIVAGDFNANAGGEGYQLLVDPAVGGLRDSYAEANPRGFGDVTFPGDRSRIDYIFTRQGDPLRAKTSQVYFRAAEALGGRVSDHLAVITRFAALP